MTDATDARWGVASPTHEPALLADFRPRATDVLITTAPKCGTTWMQHLLHQLRTGGDADFAVLGEVVPWLEFPLPDPGAPSRAEGLAAQSARYEAMADPRIFKTHCTAAQTPGLDTARIVLTSRDPRDACVSMYHHKRDMTDAARAAVGLAAPDGLDAHVAQWLAFGAWYRNVKSWWPERHRSNLLWLRYEDLVADLPTAVDRLAAFLGWPLTEAQRDRVLTHGSFAWMQARADRFTRMRADAAPGFKPGGFIREGKVGAGRAALSPAACDAILAKARAELPADCLAFLGLA